MRAIVLLLNFCFVAATTFGQSSDCPLQVKVTNGSKYTIRKVEILGQRVGVVVPGGSSEWMCPQQTLYTNSYFDISFSKRKKWSRLIIQPYDHIGEGKYTEGKFELRFYIKKRKKGDYDVKYKVKEISTVE